VAVAYSRSGLFICVGTNTIQAQLLAKWADTVNDKLEGLVGIPTPLEPESVRLVGQTDPAPHAAGRLETTNAVVRGTLQQAMLVVNQPQVNAERAHEAFVGLLLNAHIFGAWRRGGGRGPTEPPVVPLWLERGIGQNLYRAQRARNNSAALALWQRGQMRPLASLLAATGRDPDEPFPASRAVLGTLLRWLLSLDNHRQVFERLFAALAAGDDITAEWLAATVAGRPAAPAAEELWDNWLLAQRRAVLAPGQATPEAISLLKAELLLYPGSFGIPLTAGASGPRDLSVLIAERNSEWVLPLIQARTASLRLLAIGRGPEFGSVVDAYCRFLDAVPVMSPRELKRLLEAANGALAILEGRVQSRLAADLGSSPLLAPLPEDDAD
jgi:hypothetical protein